MSDADIVSAMQKPMLLTTNEVRLGDVPENSPRCGRKYQTAIHHFGLSDAGASYIASGAASGSVINQFAMHEIHDTFFIATTDDAR